MPSEGALRDRESAGFELIETLRWEPARGFVRLDRHMARLEASARALGFGFSRKDAAAALEEAVRGGAPLRVRLALARDGACRATVSPFVPLPDGAVWRLAIAGVRLDASDPLLRHKTTRRDLHEAARAEFAAGEADEVLLLNGEGMVCEGSFTNVFVEDADGMLLTPPLGCGLLPGVLRAELLASGRAREAELRPADLAGAQALHVGNSLRGLIRARLVR